MRGQGKHNFWYFIYLFIFILQLSVEVLILWACVHFQAFLFSLKVINNPCKLLGALILLWDQECTGVTYAIFPQDIFLSTNQNSTSTFIFKRNPPRSAMLPPLNAALEMEGSCRGTWLSVSPFHNKLAPNKAHFCLQFLEFLQLFPGKQIYNLNFYNFQIFLLYIPR